MTRFRVGTGFRSTTLEAALGQCRPGDVITLAEGTYAFDVLQLHGVTLTGIGDGTKVVVQAQLTLSGDCQLSNLTVQPQPFHNAVRVLPQGNARLTKVGVLADPAGKFPALFAEAAAIELDTSWILQDEKTRPAIELTQRSYLKAVRSSLGTVSLHDSRTEAVDVSAGSMVLAERSRLDAPGAYYSNPADGYQALVLGGESVAVLADLRLSATAIEATCQDSFLSINSLAQESEATFTISHSGQGRVAADHPGVTLVGEGQGATPSPAVTEPKVVRWRLEDADRFAEVVAPHIGPGDTVLLDEGEYELGAEGLTGLNCELAGKGRASHTVVHGGLTVHDSGRLALTNLTVRPKPRTNAVIVRDGEALLKQVILEPCPESEFSPLFVAGDGRVVAQDCQVRASTEQVHGVVTVQDEAVLEASTSFLGWLSVSDTAQTELDDCSMFQVSLGGGAQVRSRGTLWLDANAADRVSLFVNDGGDADIERLGFANPVEGVVAGSLQVGEVQASGDAFLALRLEGDAASARVPDQVVIDDGQGMEPEQVQVSASGGVGVPAGEGTDVAGEDLPPAETEDVSVPAAADPMAEIMALTGLDSVKKQIRAFVQTVTFNEMRKAQGLKVTDHTLHSLFLGNPGTGKTTVARLLGRTLHAAGATRTDTFIEVKRKDLVGQHLGESARLTAGLLNRALGGVLFIDEAYALYQERNNEFAQEAVDTLITFMEDHRDDLVVILAGYTEQMRDFMQMNPGLASRIPNEFDFEDYRPEEVAEIGYRALIDNDYTVDEVLYRRTAAARYRASIEGGNARWVRNFNQALVAEMAQRVVASVTARPDSPLDMQTITAADIHAVAGGDQDKKQETLAALLEELDSLIGLAPVKRVVRDLVTEVQADRHLSEIEGFSGTTARHMVFTGNPGTGKTTVAGIVARIFCQLDILEKATVINVDRSQLVGSHIGETERNTTRVIDAAMGGVLFVDEAYQLWVEDSPRDFGKLAIETFMTRLENDRDKFVAIFAGYSHEMDVFLDANPGLRSRIPEAVHFPDYTPHEVGQVAVLTLTKTWTIDEEFVVAEAARRYELLPDRAKSNGRWARDFAKAIEKQHKRWLVESGIRGPDALAISNETVAATPNHEV